MRVVSGKLKGRKIPELKNLELRPTTDFAKEGLFNILQHQLDFFLVDAALDLFSGTGSLSYEMASRGIRFVLAVEQSAIAVKFIDKMREIFSLEQKLEVLQSDAFVFLDKNKKKYQLIVADPPFSWEQKEYEELFTKCINALDENGLLVIEHSSDVNLSHLDFFENKRKFGNVNFSFFKAQKFKA